MTLKRNPDARQLAQEVQDQLEDVMEYLRGNVTKVGEPQLKAMFETAAEVLGGLKKAFSDYEKKNESAWR